MSVGANGTNGTNGAKLPVCLGILAGGKSRRMGQNKAWMPVANSNAILHLLGKFTAQCEQTIINANSELEKFTNLPAQVQVVSDELSTDYLGPLAGLQAIAQATDCQWIFCVACDLLLLPDSLIATLHKQALAAECEVVVPSSAGYLHTTCTLIRRSACAQIGDYLASGKRRPDQYYQQLKQHIWCDEREVYGYSIYMNANTPEELAQINELLLQHEG